jgi:mono/diheme cytochrome c family protein
MIRSVFSFFLLSLAFGVVFTLAACHSPAALTAQQQEGKQLYDDRCAHCHERNDLALQKVPPNLHGVFDHATLPSGAPASDQNVQRAIFSGIGMMPPFQGQIDQEQVNALVAYLHTGLK